MLCCWMSRYYFQSWASNLSAMSISYWSVLSIQQYWLSNFNLQINQNNQAQKKYSQQLYRNQNVMDLFMLSVQTFSSLSIELPFYVALSPLCMISSKLYKDALGFNIDDQTVMLIITLVALWAISAFMIFHLIQIRAHKTIFFYEFVLFISMFNFILIGVTYSILRRNSLFEEVMAKIFTSMLTILTAEKLKIRTEAGEIKQCRICFQLTNKTDCLMLSCRHSYHQKCLWDWIYIKQQCPVCMKKIY